MSIQLTEQQRAELIEEAQTAFWAALMNRIDPSNQHDLGGWASVSQMGNDEALARVAAEAIEDFLSVVDNSNR